MTTPNIPNWEPEANRPGLKWEDPVLTAKRLVPVLRGKERCDFVVVLIHSGPEIDLVTGAPDGTAAENRVAALAWEVPGIDLLLTGHTHRKIPLTRINGVPLIQPGRWGEFLARVDVTFERKGRGWQVSSLTGALLPSDVSVAVDSAIAAIARPHDERARAYLDETIAVANEALPASRARLEDTALLDLVNEAQLEATGADLSMTSLLPGGRFEGLPKGPITVRNVFALYPYENQLVAVEIDGVTLKACLERAAEFYGAATWDGGRLVLTPKEGMIPYNFDVVQGASYRIDPTAPVGSRVKDLSFHGQPVKPGDRFTLAVNSYRAQGSGGYTALKGSKVVKVVSEEIRELLITRLKAAGHVRPHVDHNWVVAPDSAWVPDAFTYRRGN
jgi:2',3'-cyclic-nucleotide 2'-phosphodiesterase/3'-nucleotidase